MVGELRAATSRPDQKVFSEGFCMARFSSSDPFKPSPISLGERMATSTTFKLLFRDGMSLVEAAAAYLDGPGRAAAKLLPRRDALSYASESMRLTTRLMQLASWLLLQRAVNEGEMTRAQAAAEKHKVKLAPQDLATEEAVFARLPEELRQLCLHSLRLQARIIHLDQLLYAPKKAQEPQQPPPHPLDAQHALLRQAFENPKAP
jgi:regulator of CtrA degradation